MTTNECVVNNYFDKALLQNYIAVYYYDIYLHILWKMLSIVLSLFHRGYHSA